MRYEIDTIQYGEFKDTSQHENMEGLLHDLRNIHKVRASTQIIEIRDQGKPISRTRTKVLQALALR